MLRVGLVLLALTMACGSTATDQDIEKLVAEGVQSAVATITAATGTPQPTLTMIPQRTPTPNPTYTPVQTYTPPPTYTPVPTFTPRPPPTPTPTATPRPKPTATPLPTATPTPTCQPISESPIPRAVRNTAFGYQVEVPRNWSLNALRDTFWSLSADDGLISYAIVAYPGEGDLLGSSLESFHLSHGEFLLREAAVDPVISGTVGTSSPVNIWGVQTVSSGFSSPTMLGFVRSFTIGCDGFATMLSYTVPISRQHILDFETIEASLFGSMK